jgi:hypothetical protein
MAQMTINELMMATFLFTVIPPLTSIILIQMWTMMQEKNSTPPSPLISSLEGGGGVKKSTHSTPRSEARDMLRVDIEWSFLPRFKKRGLEPSNVSN